ncbi:unnamed protein product [Ceratitis capitata]|uniref:(Mediterranean fruit fly) hypothetical protein n=1 Tax=Ceratitis capitata TaxID=7213 RepID=A0A811V297_CERCA|nr:unnamed protein product [Ceratitis capitata]
MASRQLALRHENTCLLRSLLVILSAATNYHHQQASHANCRKRWQCKSQQQQPTSKIIGQKQRQVAFYEAAAMEVGPAVLVTKTTTPLQTLAGKCAKETEEARKTCFISNLQHEHV